jgi:hypothetical protein
METHGNPKVVEVREVKKLSSNHLSVSRILLLL